MTTLIRDRTIEDFGNQWTRFTDNSGYFGSLELLCDFFHPILDVGGLEGCRAAEIGSGTGRIVNMLLEAGAEHVVAVEPSDAFDVLVRNTRARAEKVTCLQTRGDQLPAFGDLDFVFSVGVMHHIPEPGPVVEAAYRALRPGGRFAIWVYGKEGNRLYLTFARPLRAITQHLPHAPLNALVRALDLPLSLYIKACRRWPLPMQHYMTEVMGRLTPDKRRLGIYDQLNPAHAKYYTLQEAYDLLYDGGFRRIRFFHRHGYSWSLIGTKPEQP